MESHNPYGLSFVMYGVEGRREMKTTVNKVAETVMWISLLLIVLVGMALDTPGFRALIAEFVLCVPFGISTAVFNLTR